MRIVLALGLVGGLAGCMSPMARCIAAAEDPVARLDAAITRLDAQLVAGEVSDRRAGNLRLAELEARRARAVEVRDSRVAACRR